MAERAVTFEEHRDRHKAELEAAAEARRQKDMGKGRKKRTADQLAAEEAEKILYSLNSKRPRRSTRRTMELEGDREFTPESTPESLDSLESLVSGEEDP